MPRPRKTASSKSASGNAAQTGDYRHSEETPARPDVGTQPPSMS